MIATNACDGIINNPQLEGSIMSLVKTFYKKHADTFKDAAFDWTDLYQELMIELCEEKHSSKESHYQVLCECRLKNILIKIKRESPALDEYIEGMVESAPY